MNKKQQKQEPLTREPGKKKVASRFTYPDNFKLTPKSGQNPTALILGQVTEAGYATKPTHTTHRTTPSLEVRLTTAPVPAEEQSGMDQSRETTGLSSVTPPTQPTAVISLGILPPIGDPAVSRGFYFTPAELKMVQYAAAIRDTDWTFWLRLREAMSLASIGSKNTVQDAVRRLEDKGIFRRLYYRSGLRSGIRYELSTSHLDGQTRTALEGAVPELTLPIRKPVLTRDEYSPAGMGGLGAPAHQADVALPPQPSAAGHGDAAPGDPGHPYDDDEYDDDLHHQHHQVHLVENRVPREVKDLFIILSLLPWKASFDDDYAALIHTLRNQGITTTLETLLSTMKVIGLRAKSLGNRPNSFRFFLTAIPRELQKETEEELRLIWLEIQHALVGQQERPPISELVAKLKNRAVERGIAYAPAMIERIITG